MSKFVLNKRTKLNRILLLILIVLTACGIPEPEIETVSTNDSISVSPTRTCTTPVLSTPSIQPTEGLTAIPITFPTYEPITQEVMVAWLDEKLSNPECDLPCLWGITPGETNVLHAYQIIAQIATSTTQFTDYSESDKSGFRFYFDILPISPGDPYYRYGFEYVGNEVVFLTMSDIWSYSSYSIQNILKQYGPPEEIWLEAWSPDPAWDDQKRGSTFIFYYPSQRFLIKYSQSEDEQIITKDSVTCCIAKAIELNTWSDSNAQKIDDFYRENYLFREIRPFLQLEDVTGMSPEEFYETFVNTTGDVCVETPLDIWLSSKSGEFD